MLSTIRLYLLCVSLLFLVSCASVEIPNFRVWVELPASKEGYSTTTISDETQRISKEEWEEKRKYGLVLMPEDYAIIKKNYYKMCITMKCKQSVAVLDGIFQALDEAIKAANGASK